MLPRLFFIVEIANLYTSVVQYSNIDPVIAVAGFLGFRPNLGIMEPSNNETISFPPT
jgi:hypothetical protein